MSKSVVVDGGRRINGTVETSGFKHSLATIVGAACCAQAPIVIGNCPAVAEASVLAALVTDLGGLAQRTSSELQVDATRLSSSDLDYALAGSIHGSVYLIPGLLARAGRASLPGAGGCQIGAGPGGRRPIDHYVDVLRRFGACVVGEPDSVPELRAERLSGCEIDLLDYTHDRRLRTGPLYSGATKTAILAAAVAHGSSVLRNPYPKPDVGDMVEVLRGFGADIERDATGSLVVRGRGPAALCRPVRHDLMPDLIEIVTFICAGTLLAASRLVVRGPGMARACDALAPELHAMEALGVQVQTAADAVTVMPSDRLRAAHVLVSSHGIYSDSHPFLTLLLAHAQGASSITETVWPNRFGYAEGLRALGVRLRNIGAVVRVDGPSPPAVPGQVVRATDVRAAAVLLLAALEVEGRTVIEGSQHLERGYSDLPGTLRALGARVHEVTDVAA